jgi:cell division protein FtsI/penicillin-binding protein 2
MGRQNSNTPEDKNIISKILLIFYWALLLLSCIVIGRIFYIQFIWEPPTQSIENFTPHNTSVEIKPERGDIMDCNRKLLASSTPLYTIRLDCHIQKSELEKHAIKMGKDSLTEDSWRRLARETCDQLPEIIGQLVVKTEHGITSALGRMTTHEAIGDQVTCIIHHNYFFLAIFDSFGYFAVIVGINGLDPASEWKRF